MGLVQGYTRCHVSHFPSLPTPQLSPQFDLSRLEFSLFYSVTLFFKPASLQAALFILTLVLSLQGRGRTVRHFARARHCALPLGESMIELRNSPGHSYPKRGRSEDSLREFAIGITSFPFIRVMSWNNIQLLMFKQA